MSAAKPAPERPPRGRSGGGISARKLAKPPQGHRGYKHKIERKPPRSSGPPRYETTNARERMLVSAVRLAEQRGYESLRIADVTDPVGVRRQAFYAHFKDKRHCLCEAIDPKLGAIVELASSSEESAPRWAEHVIAAIDETLQERFHSPYGTRARIVSAMIEMLRESESFDAIRIGMLVKRAHVPNGDFYRQFSGKRECFAAAYEEMLDGLVAEVRAECSAEHSGPRPPGGSAEPRTSVPVLIEFLGSKLISDPIRLRLLVVEAAHLPDLPSEDLAGAWRGSFGAAMVELLGDCSSADADDSRFPFIAGSLIEAIRSAVVADQADAMTERLLSVGEGLGVDSGHAGLGSRLAA